MKWMALLIFGGIGLGALIGGAMWGLKRYPLLQNGLRAQGKVVAQDETTSTEFSILKVLQLHRSAALRSSGLAPQL